MGGWPGRFITLEGPDGCGKSTQARLLAEALASAGHDVILTREPGGSAGAEDIRALLVTGRPERWSPVTETLLFTAARRDHLERLILPALMAGKTVICDRFADSTRVYQGAAREGGRDLVDRLHDLAIGHDPDLTLILDLPGETGLARGLARVSGEDRFEELGSDFQDKVRNGFRALAAEFPARCRLIDASGTTAEVAARIAQVVAAHMASAAGA